MLLFFVCFLLHYVAFNILVPIAIEKTISFYTKHFKWFNLGEHKVKVNLGEYESLLI